MSNDDTNENQITPNQVTDNDTTDGPTEAEILDSLKNKAKLLGVTFSNNIGIDALRKRIAEHEAAQENEAAGSTEAEAEPAVSNHMSVRNRLRKENLKLVRVRITNMNPDKADLKGEIFAVRNKFIGTVKRFIPFGEDTENGTHVENILLKQLKKRKFLRVKTNPKTNVVESQLFVPEFAIEVLPQLTEEELKRLANQQAAARGMAD